ncbi:hypothetical protein Pcinc_034614 [Petrolisthes cinctipes]|uniref:Glycosyltransferase 2-like domain-containing protein n=1 Tax=Petrolisthes cinctipes TaxID=88211 RepID=A0AAE1EPS0_PETCI|nr:hypothetical protein Pcinc_034614 [Petrolisthes cinctipes]
MEKKRNIDVSVIIPVHNAELWLSDCLASLAQQTTSLLNVEVSLFLDSCSDNSMLILCDWNPRLRELGYTVTVVEEDNVCPKGVGYAKNKAVRQSSGEYLCFMDADDRMMPTRIQRQYEVAVLNPDVIVGSKFVRDPSNSTPRYTHWANSLNPEQLSIQIYTSHGPTVIMPTWFCHCSVFERVGGFSEAGKGTPEDLIFFFNHVRHGGGVLRVDEELLVYRYHQQATTFSVHEDTIWALRIQEIENHVLCSWDSFTIWNAGKQGRKFYRSLSEANRRKVVAFCDVDVKKIGSFYTYEETTEKPKPRVPIIHFKDTTPPLIICMKMGMTDGVFEENLASLNLKEGKDYHHFN